MGCWIGPVLEDVGWRWQPYLVLLNVSYRTHAEEKEISSHVRFSPNSRFVLAATQDSTIRLWNYHTSRCVKTYVGHTNRTYCIATCFSTIGSKYIVSGSEDAKVYIWDLQSRQVVQALEGHRGEINLWTNDTWAQFNEIRRCCPSARCKD